MRYVQRAIGIYGDASNAIFYLNFKQTLIAAHIADCADNAVLAALLLHGGAVDAARWFQLRICITACPAPIGVLSVQWCLQEICCR